MTKRLANLFLSIVIFSYHAGAQTSTSVEMVRVDGGTFLMGSEDYARPVHRVTVNSFMISKYEVTQDHWERIMGSNNSDNIGRNKPADNVSWEEAITFCNRLSEKDGLQKAYSGSGGNIKCNFNSNGYRLPTEAEWEFAARGGNNSNGFIYSGSNDIDRVACYMGSGSGLKNVGSLSGNELGIHDMSGNVWEWCWDWFGDYSSKTVSNPTGPVKGRSRLLRGGSQYTGSEECRVDYREQYLPNIRVYPRGIRLVRAK